jgi:hypothetical protein
LAEGQSLKTFDIGIYKIFDFEISIWQTGNPTTTYATVCHYCGGIFPAGILKAEKVSSAAAFDSSNNRKTRKINVSSIWHVLLKGSSGNGRYQM